MSAGHEKIISHDVRDPPSIKSFGFTMAVVFAVIGIFPVLFRHDAPHIWALAIAAFFAIAALIAPNTLKPLNQLWFRLGQVLHRVVNPLVLGLLFVVLITPIALILRVLGKRLIPLAPDPAAESYWNRREPPGPTPESLRNQF